MTDGLERGDRADEQGAFFIASIDPRTSGANGSASAAAAATRIISSKIKRTGRELAFRLMARKIGLTDRKVFDAAYTAELKVLEPRLESKPIAIQATLDEIAKTDPRAKQVRAEELIGRRFLEEVEKDGT